MPARGTGDSLIPSPLPQSFVKKMNRLVLHKDNSIEHTCEDFLRAYSPRSVSQYLRLRPSSGYMVGANVVTDLVDDKVSLGFCRPGSFKKLYGFRNQLARKAPPVCLKSSHIRDASLSLSLVLGITVFTFDTCLQLHTPSI